MEEEKEKEKVEKKEENGTQDFFDMKSVYDEKIKKLTEDYERKLADDKEIIKQLLSNQKEIQDIEEVDPFTKRVNNLVEKLNKERR